MIRLLKICQTHMKAHKPGLTTFFHLGDEVFI